VSNSLTPPGLVGSHKHANTQNGDPIAIVHPMPADMGACVQTQRGTRRLMPEETSRGLGVEKEWKVDPKKITKGPLERMTSLFHWEHLSKTLSRVERTKAKSTPHPSDPLNWNEMRDKTRLDPVKNVPFS
jgi:hypothetical protein